MLANSLLGLLCALEVQKHASLLVHKSDSMARKVHFELLKDFELRGISRLSYR